MVKKGDAICPVAALTGFPAIRGQTLGPLFKFQDGSPLSKDRFIHIVHAALSNLGYDPSIYAGHSFRIGAATTATERGIEDSTIKVLHRWKSEAFQSYSKIPRSKLALLSAVLVRCLQTDSHNIRQVAIGYHGAGSYTP